MCNGGQAVLVCGFLLFFVIKFNTGRVNGQICTKQVTSLESWILSEGRPAMGISFPLDIFSFFGRLAVLECGFLPFSVFCLGLSCCIEFVYKWAFSFPLDIFFV